MKDFIFLFVSVFLLISCNNNYDQSYLTYTEFEKANEQNKVWFPKIIDSSCTEIKCRTNIKYAQSYGKFVYNTNGVVDSILSIKGLTQCVSTNTFQIELAGLKTENAEWFITKDKIFGKSIWKKAGYYFAKDTAHHTVYFIATKN